VLVAYPDACFTVDVKEGSAVAPLARILRATNAGHRVGVAGGWLAGVRTEVGPELMTALGWRALAAFLAGAPQAAGAARFAHVPSRVVQVFGARLVARAQALGVRIIVWTVNDPAQMHRLLDLGMDGIITDRPDLLREVLVARDQWVAPSPTPSPTTSERPS